MPPLLDTSNLDSLNKALDDAGFEREPESPSVTKGSQPLNGFARPDSFDAISFLSAHGIRHRPPVIDGGTTKYVLEECPFDENHKAPDAALLVFASGAVSFKCLHNSCASYKWQDLRRKLYPGCYDRKPNGASQPLASSASEPNAIAYQRITAAELDAATYETEFLIEGTLVAGQPLIVAGGKKCLKTNILLDAAISLATATPMLGTLKVNRPVRVAVMSGESGLATIQETSRRIARSKGIELASIDGLIFSPDLPRIGDVRHQIALAKFLRDDKIETVSVDPAYLSLPSEDNGNLFAQGNLLRELTTVCADAGASLILCHHTKRTGVDPFQPPELEHIAWAGFQEFARQWWLLGRRERFDPESDGEHRLWLNVGGSAGFASLWAVDITEGKFPSPRRWEVALARPTDARNKAAEQAKNSKQAREQARLNDDVAALLDVAGRYPKGETKTVLRSGTGLNSERLNAAVASALKSGKLVTCDVFKSGKKKPLEGFKLPPKVTHQDHPD